ncbi:hypothetical protein CIG75_10125 [Tumebacillus algifaecis]|uniref:Uncharacterized protein n=1 Tax=Tumebacillus algifaecis TaxID=1214604 RepID=A0A223D185_9BACL|nr:hypothetical protein [Tumebacillus algifaecis]ASS75311.1 hypothetical protein CIG75_10125 [Tumebacillus algifaecis]
MSERQVQVKSVVVWEAAPQQKEPAERVLPFPTSVPETQETTMVEWSVGGTPQLPVRLIGVTSGFGDVSKASPRCLAA